MTDLERVRETLADHVRGRDHYLEADEWGKCKWESALEALDAHLKEDAEREADAWRWCNERDEAHAELTELREHAERLGTDLLAERVKYKQLREAVRDFVAHKTDSYKRLRQLIDGVD